ncbi:MAG TPA: hypothetical protein VKR58_09385 [Aquella sp.]|nr:hypothetical protein [Aquella sp.]
MKHRLINGLLFSLLILYLSVASAYNSWDVRPFVWAVQNTTNHNIEGEFAAFNVADSTVPLVNSNNGNFHRAIFSLINDGIAPRETKISAENGIPAPFANDHWCIEFTTTDVFDRRAWINLPDQICNLSNEDVVNSSSTNPVKIVISEKNGDLKVDIVKPNGQIACPIALIPRPSYFKGCSVERADAR